MTGFFIGLFLGSIVTLIVAACFSQEREQEAYWNGYRDGLNRAHEDARKAVEHEGI